MQTIPMYRIKDFLNEPIKVNFYASELQKLKKKVKIVYGTLKRKKTEKRLTNTTVC